MTISGDYDEIQSVMKLIIRLGGNQVEYGVIGSPEFLLLSSEAQQKLLNGWITLLNIYKDKIASGQDYEEPHVIH